MNEGRRHYRRWVFLGLFAMSGLWFFLLERLIPVPQYWLHARLDDFIPFVPVFVIPYCMWYFYIGIPCTYLFFKKPDDFCKLAGYLAAGMSIACCVYTLLPNGQQLRPAVLGEGPFNALIGLLYSLDTPVNSAPSLHVIHSMGCHGAFVRIASTSRHRKLILTASSVVLVLIILSTVFIKQHSVIDLVAGLLVGSLLYFAVYGRTSEAYQRLRPASQKSY